MTTPQYVNLSISAGGSSTGVGFDQFEAGYDLTQNGNQINRHNREILIPSYDYLPNQYPYYIIAELYCSDSTAKTSIIKRRRIEIEPNGQIHDIYGLQLSVDENNEVFTNNENLIVYPNPTKTSFSVSNVGGWSTLNVYTLNGKLMQSETFDMNNPILTVDISIMSSGTYIIEAIGNGTKVRTVLVKM